MNIKIIFKTGLETLIVSGIIFSCNRAQDSSEIKSKLNESVELVQGDLDKEILELKSEAENVIAEFNDKTFEIRREALKSKSNIDADIKQRIIDIENQIAQLEDKLEDLHNQSRETWSEFSQSMKNELTDMKRNIDNLTRKNSG
jgi:phage host-nuclease inhibitor protein Gam